MTDYRIPKLPSDDELGITKKDLEEYSGDDKPELSEKEMAALLGEAPRAPAPPPPPPPKGAPSQKPHAKEKEGKQKKAKEPKAKPEPRAQQPEGPRSGWRGTATLVALLAAAWFTSGYRTLPAPVPANAADTTFSSARAMTHLVEIARRPHPTGSPAHTQVRDYLLERLRGLGLEPDVQTTTSLVGRESFVRAATVRNIVARIPGTASSGSLVVTAHYDGREIARAAADAGFGVVSILEMVRALQAGASLRNDVLLLITDSEELGLLGARAFVAEHPAMADVKAVVSLEMRGGGGPSIMFETGAENGWIIRALAASGAVPFANSLSYEVYKSMPNDTDFTPFREAGRQGLNFAALGRASLYHQSYDSPENISEATLQHEGASALALARYLGNQPLGEVKAPDVTYFTVPVLGLVVYDLAFTLPLAAAVLILALLVLLPVRQASAGWGGIVTGFVLSLVAIPLGAAAGWSLLRWLPRFHPEFGSLHGSAFHHEGWYVAALVAAGLAVVTGLFGLVRRRFGMAELAWGALLAPLAAMAFVSFRWPSAAASLQVPLAAAYLAVGVSSFRARGWARTLTWLLLVALALPVLALLVPLAEFLWLGLSFRAAAFIGGFAVVVLLLLLPALDALREPNAWWAPLTALVVGGACLGLGIRAAAPDAARPAPSTLAYAFDHGSGEALWVTDASQEPVDSLAGAWAVQRAGAAFSETRDLAAFGFGSRQPRVAPAPAKSIRKPEVWALSDTTWGDVRHLRIAVLSGVGAELMQFRFPEGGGTRLVALNGRSLPAPDRPTVAEHWGQPDPVVVLDLEVPAARALEMDVVEHLFRPGEIVGDEPFQRPAELAPDVTWLSDRAVLRSPAGSLVIIPGPPPFPLETAAQLRAEAALAAAALPTDTLPTDTVPTERR
ncbi:MAG TPA: M28 family peptidase [Longimicrobiales bacterium]|nr:M28 family peptidase [Longimicrobiales bacterium]